MQAEPAWLTLAEAGDRVRITEAVGVRVANLGDLPLLLLDGEQLVGAKQNRILNMTVLVAAQSEVLAISDGPAAELTRSEAPQQTLVVGVRPDPEPSSNVSVEDGESAIAEADTGRVDGAGGMDLFKPQARKLRIVSEESVRRARGAVCVRAAQRTRFGSARSSSTSKGIWVEGFGAACPMLVERLVCEARQGIVGLTKGSVPALVGVQLFEDGGRKLVLLPFREAASGLECFPQGVSHRVLTRKIVSRAKEITPLEAVRHIERGGSTDRVQ
jgi:hypothetical protein